MRRPGFLILLPAAAFALACAGEAEAADAKYGVVNVQRVLRTSKGGREASASLDAEKKKLESVIRKRRDDLTRLADKIRDLQSEIEQKGAIWREEERERKAFELRSEKRDFAREQDDLKRLVRESQRDLQKRQRAALTKALKEVRGVVHEIGKKEGLDVIVDSGSGGVLFASPSVDLTEKVIRLYDRKKK